MKLLPEWVDRKGMSSSALPYKRSPPSWLKITTAEVEEHICKLAKKGLTPSQIGVILRDSHGIAQVNSVTGSKVLRILKGHGICFCHSIWICMSNVTLVRIEICYVKGF